MSKTFLLSVLCLSLVGFVLSGANPPNVILMMADDLGYNDLSCYGSKRQKTPVLDKLAKEGLRTLLCGPTDPLALPCSRALILRLERRRGRLRTEAPKRIG